MKKWSFALLVVLIFSVTLNNTAIAKEKNVSIKQKKKAEVVDTSPIVPFDINKEKLPPNYKGTPIDRLYSLFVKMAPLKKEEFETTAEYETKIAAAVHGDIYAFIIDQKPGLHIPTVSYDADKQKFQIGVRTDWLSPNTNEDYRASFIVKSVNDSSSSYIGSNAYGATRKVTDLRATRYGLALVNQQDFGSSDSDDKKHDFLKTPMTSLRTVNIEISIPPDKARTLKDSIGILLVCKPILYKVDAKISHRKGNDLIFEQYDFSEATINSPSSHTYEQKYINVEILALWIYDIRTGEVILKKAIERQ